MSELWNRCDVCGEFIPLDDFHKRLAIRKLITPDSVYTREEYETLCRKHAPGSAQPTPPEDA